MKRICTYQDQSINYISVNHSLTCILRIKWKSKILPASLTPSQSQWCIYLPHCLKYLEIVMCHSWTDHHILTADDGLIAAARTATQTEANTSRFILCPIACASTFCDLYIHIHTATRFARWFRLSKVTSFKN
jgi:hypothetical protein